MNVPNRAMTNASPRSPPVTSPSGLTAAELVVVREEHRQASSRRGRCRPSSVPARSSAGSSPCRRVPPRGDRDPRRRAWAACSHRRWERRPRSTDAASGKVRSEASNRLPPVCWTAPIDFLQQRAIRRHGQVDSPADHLAGQPEWSPSGSKPKSEIRKPSLPRAAPWQLPVLQPAFMKTGITSSRKLKGGVTVAWVTLTGTLTESGRRK